MERKPVKYYLVDTFTDTAFKGNPSSVCLLVGEKDVAWLQKMAREFNQATTSYLTQLTNEQLPEFNLRWFTRFGDEIPLCGHATLAASHFLLANVLPHCDSVKLSTLSGPLIVRRIIQDSAFPKSFSIEMDFPVLPLVDYNDMSEVPSVSELLNGAPILEIKKTALENYLFVVLPTGEDVEALKPQIDAIRNYPVRGVIITGPAPPGSRFDFYVRFFCPNLGADEDHVCGSCHCALAPYWSKRLGKNDFMSYQASERSGVINVYLDAKNRRVKIGGKAVTIMEGYILV